MLESFSEGLILGLFSRSISSNETDMIFEHSSEAEFMKDSTSLMVFASAIPESLVLRRVSFLFAISFSETARKVVGNF